MSEMPKGDRMIKVFYGNDRAKIAQEVKKLLGEDYEVFDGAEGLTASDIVNIFQGNSLFSAQRKILLKDIAELDLYEEISKYVDTPHTIVIWETSVSQKKAYKDFIKMPGVSAQKFESVLKIDIRQVFEVFDMALVDGLKAVKMLEKIQGEEDPYMFFGLLVSQAVRKFEGRQGTKERRVLKILSETDMQMKSTAVEPWTLIKVALLRFSEA